MRLPICLCVLVGAVLLGCQPQPNPTPTPPPYALPSHEVTNGVCIVFETMPATDLVSQLTSAGAVINNNGTIFLFDTVNTEPRRLAVRAALLNGATLKGAPR